MTDTQPRNPRLDALTGVRFFAAMHVVIFHNADFFSGAPAWVRSLIHHGYSGVSLFFILSGFILSWSYLSRPSIDIRAFLVARVARIYPAYLFALVLALPLYLYFLARTLTPTQAAAKGLLITVAEATLLQAWTPYTMDGANPPGWSLSVEGFLYLAFPLVGLRLARCSSRVLAASVVGLWLLAILPPALHALVQPPPPDLPGPRWIEPSIPFLNLLFANPLLHLAQFSAGIAAGILFLRGVRVKWPPLMATLAELALLVAVAGVFFATSAGWVTEPMMNTGFLVLLYVPLLILLASGQGAVGRLLSHRWLVLLGGASYGIYILQVPIRSWMQVLGRVILGLEWSATFFVAYVVTLVAVSVAVFYAEERIRPPLRAYLLRKVRRATPAVAERSAR